MFRFRRSKQALSTDQIHLLVFVIRCARAMYMLQERMTLLKKWQMMLPKYLSWALPKKAVRMVQRLELDKLLPPADERIPSPLLAEMITEGKKLLPRWRWTPSSKKMPMSGEDFAWEFFLAVNTIWLSRGEITRTGHNQLALALDRTYTVLIEIGARIEEKKRIRRKKEQLAEEAATFTSSAPAAESSVSSEAALQPAVA